MANDDRIRQVKTTKEKYGKDHYSNIAKQVKNRPTKFTSETARKAQARRWEIYREKHKGKGENATTQE